MNLPIPLLSFFFHAAVCHVPLPCCLCFAPCSVLRSVELSDELLQLPQSERKTEEVHHKLYHFCRVDVFSFVNESTASFSNFAENLPVPDLIMKAQSLTTVLMEYKRNNEEVYQLLFHFNSIIIMLMYHSRCSNLGREMALPM